MPDIFPVLHQATIPPNIAPLNFMLNDSCNSIEIELQTSEIFLVESFIGNKVKFSQKQWREILNQSSGDTLSITVYAIIDEVKHKYDPIHLYVAPEPIDDFLVYRLIMPGFQTWNEMGIYQRKLSTFDEKPILNSKVMPGTCMNCHSFAGKESEHMMLHLRENFGGTVIKTGDALKKVHTKTEQTFASAGFPYWHPSGKYIAFSINSVRQIFHAKGHVRAHALDMKSDMAIYNVEENDFFTSPVISSDESFEAFPCFSPDGETLYFVTAPAGELPRDQTEMKYSLVAVSFDPHTGRTGSRVDTLISARETGQSVSIPRVSPNGKLLLITQFDYGNFPAYNPEADLYLYNLETDDYYALDKVNSNDVESYHTWSSNSRWIVFSSRRRDGLYMDAWIAYIDEHGKGHTPFMLPQKDPEFLKHFMFSYNIPELVKSEVNLNPYDIAAVARKTEGEQAGYSISH